METRALLTIDFTGLFGIGGSGLLTSSAVAIDNAGNTYVTGAFSGKTSLDTSDAGQAKATTDVFVAKFNPSGQPVWSHHYGNVTSNQGTSQGQGIGVDAAGNVFVTGLFTGVLDFDPAHPGTHTVSAFGGDPNHPTTSLETFVLKLDANGNFGASSYGLGTSGLNGAVNQGLAIAVAPDGTATITGDFQQTLQIGGTTLTAGSAHDPFVARISPTGTVAWAKNFSGTGGTLFSQGNSVALDAAGNAYVAGVFRSKMTFGPGVTLTSANDAGGTPSNDAFLAKLGPTGNLLYAKGFGGPGQDEADGVAVDTAGNAYLVGRYSGTAVFGQGSISTAAPGGLFLATLTPAGVVASVHDLGVTSLPALGDKPSVAVDRFGNGYVAASFQGTGSVGGHAVASAGSDDVLIAKFDLNGNVLVVRTAGGTGSDAPTGIAVNNAGKIATYGRARTPASFGKTPLISSNPSNLFIALAAEDPTNPGGDPSNPGSTGSQRFPAGDFDGDGKTDLAVFDPGTATYTIHYSSGIPDKVQQFGIANGKNQFVAGDFDGDGKTDETVFDPTTATYYIRYSGGGSRVQQFGIPNGKNMMVPGDFDGDGKTDEAVFDPVTATYYIRYSNPAFNGGSRIQQFGIPNGRNTMIPGDFDGDGKADEAVFDPVEAKYYIRYSNPAFNGGSRIQQFGIPNGKNQFVAGDFDGDGKTDETVFDPVEAKYYIRYSNPFFNGGSRILQFGVPNANNMMAPGDFDGDGKTDEAVYDPGEAKVYIRYSNPAFNGGSLVRLFGKPNAGNTLVPSLLPAGGVGALAVRSVGGGNEQALAIAPPAESAAIPPASHHRAHRVRDAALDLLA